MKLHSKNSKEIKNYGKKQEHTYILFSGGAFYQPFHSKRMGQLLSVLPSRYQRLTAMINIYV